MVSRCQVLRPGHTLLLLPLSGPSHVLPLTAPSSLRLTAPCSLPLIAPSSLPLSTRQGEQLLLGGTWPPSTRGPPVQAGRSAVAAAEGSRGDSPLHGPGTRKAHQLGSVTRRPQCGAAPSGREHRARREWAERQRSHCALLPAPGPRGPSSSTVPSSRLGGSSRPAGSVPRRTAGWSQSSGPSPAAPAARCRLCKAARRGLSAGQPHEAQQHRTQVASTGPSCPTARPSPPRPALPEASWARTGGATQPAALTCGCSQ